MGEESFNLKVLKDNEVKSELANEVLQVSFVGFTGFRFPICHFPTAGVKASDLHIIIWNCISKLWDYGFEVDYIMQDGGEENRTFMKMHFPDDPIKCNYGSPNIFLRGKNLFHTQDFSHNVKKLRNSILKSGTIKGQHTRLIMKNGKYITWRHWEKAVEWDRLTNSRRLHYKISESHLHPNIAEKMRNVLAESMSNTDMLNLMESYAQSLPDSDFLTSSVSLLQQTSKLIAIFRDSRLITNVNDKRLKDLTDIYYWFANWDKEIKESTSIPDNQKSKSLPSKECMNDIMCMLTSFPAVCIQHLNQFPEGSIKPSRFNNDVAENIFCQQKGLYNGNNGNPTYFNYSKSVNNIILGQSLKSRGRKSNAGLDSAKQFSNYSDEPVTKKPKLHKKCILPTKSSSSCDFTAKCKENYIRI
ncbi:hypothetical protein FSP39_002711 [Pinctada imbricata]|uniref:Transposable element P transposase-like RNase H domain-containing protein n=1 Tax=Pinctada imbricata TaxID=66713 RepID=A0AA89BND1_PINIB|nr:hypothetical protein FSP39_002711 [Pinctada imbricata]